jgi:hypothetical protein
MLTPVKLRSNEVNARAIPELVYPQGDTKRRHVVTRLVSHKGAMTPRLKRGYRLCLLDTAAREPL